MNIPELTKLAEWLEAGGDDRRPDGVTFYMPQYVTTERYARSGSICETAACMAGAVVSHNKGILVAGGNYASNKRVHDEATRILGLDDGIAAQLFTPEDTYDEDGGTLFCIDNVTPTWAARVVRDLIRTGYVDWEGNKP